MKNLLDVIKVEETPGKVIRAFRRSFGLTLANIERLTGVPATNLSAIENDKLDIGVRRAKLIAAVFGISPSLILFPAHEERLEDKALVRIRKSAAALIEKKKRAAEWIGVSKRQITSHQK